MDKLVDKYLDLASQLEEKRQADLEASYLALEKALETTLRKTENNE